MTQEFHLSVTPIRDHEYLVRTEQVAPGVPLAEEQVIWHVDDWLTEAGLLMGDPLLGLLRSGDLANATPHSNDAAKFESLSQGKAAANLATFGQRLYNSLFQGTIRDSWMMAQGIAQHQHQRLRFRLGLKGTNLHRLPWEVLYAGDRPLATGTEVVFSRYHSSFSVLKSHLPARQRNTGKSSQPLKILMVLATPSDQDMLALKQEAEQLRQELQTVSRSGDSYPAIDLTILEQPGREHLTQALEHNHYQVLHYAGHSNLSAAGGSIYLVNSKTGLTEVLSGEDLAGLLGNNGIRMAVFNSCRGVYTATSDNSSTEGNLAESLVRRGIPAVLAMAEQIPDDVALNLSRLFYRNLKQAYSVDLSLSRTRQGLISSYGSDKLYWALPILYLHPEFDGVLQPPTQLSGFAEPSVVPDAAFTDDRSDWALDAGSPDFDQLEFDDPDPPEEERVAQLVYELSHSPTLLESEEPLPASPLENLLSGQETRQNSEHYLSQLETAQYWVPNQSANGQHSFASGTGDSKVYSELEAVLSDMGTLTEAIAASSQAVQANPNSAEAYTNLGWALYQQGYLTEAVAAYNQAIRLDSTYAIAFNRLGLTFYQQGKVNEAVRAYSRAVQLDPTMTEASTNLRDALQERHDPIGSSTLNKVPLLVQPATRFFRKPGKWLLWLGVGAIALTTLLAGWLYREHLTNLLPSSPVPSPTTPEPPQDIKNLEPSALVTLTTQQLQQGDLATAQTGIATLLDRGKLSNADTVLRSIPAQYVNEPSVNFLKGRLAWQRWLAGDKSSSIETAQQLWEQAAQAQPNSQNQNALGFAYYAQGKIDRAEQAWLRALQLSEQTANPSQQAGTLKPETLTSYAGLALTALKLAGKQPVTQQATLRSEALKRRQTVLQNDPVNFRPEILNKNWMWSEKAIQDWRSLLDIKG